ncbi:MAG: crossover junction endodeoxyribonuclease RuvC [Saprospiraceae bacterium]|nr:crossover junction endodeoxyribonuclease RuvC [Saprospiraceae bacterium]MBK8485420.1 crossover junction endodeoxyribonuclease RuvC [Saprospiraceae bacterium]MBK9222649.1 crossover junction endodeoxyribonuclease RuvC [Saprospiraceae bacterium]MBK9727301.1 crossover junction endodeoxyribonuclease RuvC [Saprospiraceae bacterium]
MIKPERILGIDPGTNILGFGILEIKDNKPIVLDLNVIHLKEFDDHQSKLKEIFLRVQDIIETYQPHSLSIESPFFGKNAQSMHKLGRAQGVAIAAAMVMGVDIFEFSPKKIKKSITGNGNATKEQVALMLGQILKFNIDIKYFDATDALGAALCLYYQSNQSGNLKSSGNSWKKFITENPQRVS